MAVAFKPGQKFKFHDNDQVYLFIVFRFQNGDPVIIYEDENGGLYEANGYDLSDLIRV